VGSPPVLSEAIIDQTKNALDGVVAAYTSFVQSLRGISG
jgi:hypothetical protein